MDFSEQQLLALISDVYDCPKEVSGQEIVLQEELFDLEEWLYKAIQLLAFRKAEKKVELHADISCELPSLVIGDVKCLIRIIYNLLSNAMKLIPEGDVILQVSELERSADQVSIVFRVIAEGLGVRREQIDHSSTKHQHGVNSLGLASSQQLCRLMGGELGVEASSGQGTIFSIRLPFKFFQGTNPSKQTLIPPVALWDRKILIVTACPVCSEILQRKLTAIHFKVQSIRSSGGAAIFLNHARNEGHPYDLLLIGQSLDDMSGVEFAWQLKQKNRVDIPGIMLVDPADFDVVSQQVEGLGITDVIAKPVRPAVLYAAIIAAFAKQQYRIAQLRPDSSFHWSNAKVLLVDDNELAREVSRALLQNAGIQVTEAEDGVEAIKKVRTQDFDLILMDIQMPVMDGLRATRNIRRLDKENVGKIPIIAMTGHAFIEHQEEALAAGLNGHISKPIDIEALYAELDRWLPQDHHRMPIKGHTVVEPVDIAEFQTLLPDVDVAAGIRRMAGNRQAYLRLLKKFAAQYTHMETTLRRELAAGQKEAAVLHVHSLRGIAGNLGANRLFEWAGKLEAQLKADEALPALEAMLKELRQFIMTIQSVPETGESNSVLGQPMGSEREVQNLLRQLLEPLQQLQIQGVKLLLPQLKNTLWPEPYQAVVTDLEALVERYQLSLAAEKVRAFLDGQDK